jgi:glutaredoxin-like protein
MPILSPGDRETVRKHLTGVVHPVRLLLFTQTFGGPETGPMARQILDELATLNELITVEEVNFVLDKERVEAFGVVGVPGIAVMRGDDDTRMRFLGAPAGYEFMSLIEAVITAGTDEPGLSDESRALIAEVTEPLDIKVFVTPTCPHCPRAVTLAHKMAMASPLITATCVEATEFLDLSRQFHVTGVPKTVVNGTTEILGALPEDQFVLAVLGRADAHEASLQP